MTHPIDQENLAGVLENFPNQFREALELSEDFKVEGPVSEIVVCGMGGSALPADVVNIYLQNEKILKVVRDYDLPDIINDQTLVITISYSGNTEETVSCLKQALDKNARIAVITSGGKLAEIAKEKALPLVLVPSGIQPRCATGYIFTSIVQLLVNSNLISDKSDEISSLGDKLKRREYQDLAQAMAGKIKGNVPIIYAADQFFNIARICKIKFNEHSKTQSFFNSLPEMNHNEMIGYTNLVMNPYILILKSSYDHERTQKRMAIFKKLMEDRELPVSEIEMKGENLLEKCFYTLLLGDWIAYFLALEYEIDPTPVPMVEEFKDLMKK